MKGFTYRSLRLERFRRGSRQRNESSDDVSSDSADEDRLLPMIDVEAICSPDQLPGILRGYIPTLKALGKLPEDAAFIALEAESVPPGHEVTEIGLAHFPGLQPPDWTYGEKPTLERFLTNCGIVTSSFRINAYAEGLEAGSPYGAAQGERQEHESSHSKFSSFSYTDTARSDQESETQYLNPRTTLVLVGRSLREDIEHMGLDFGDVVSCFQYWIDLSALIKTISPVLMDTEVDTRTLLTTFGYPSSDSEFRRRYPQANAAVKTLAVMEGLTRDLNVDELILRYRQFDGIEVAPSVGHFDTKKYRAMIFNRFGDLYLPLPRVIYSAQRLADATKLFKPTGVGADTFGTEAFDHRAYPSDIHTPFMTRGCVCFKKRRTLRRFIRLTNGLVLDGVMLEVNRVWPNPIALKYRPEEVQKKKKARWWSSRLKRAGSTETGEDFIVVDSVEKGCEVDPNIGSGGGFGFNIGILSWLFGGKKGAED
ncbi:hypothetical protein F5Y04DRAFT_293504 [Hypomontagnella monticulosa]|nr:hypothetical protein F5Y04DRAFT_293504 [Hypomontagnella monticulosa]